MLLNKPFTSTRTPPSGHNHALARFLMQQHAPAQTFRIHTAYRTTVQSENGTLITIYPQSFMDASGRLVTEEVDIHFKEVKGRQEMIFSNVVPTCEDRILPLNNQLWLNAVQRRTPLQLVRPLEIAIEASGLRYKTASLHLFRASISSTQAFQAEKNFDWKLAPETVIKIEKRNNKQYLLFESDQMGWMNCNYLLPERGHRTMLTAKLDAPVEHFDDLIGFLALEGMEGLVRMYPGLHALTAINVPQKLSVKVLAIGLSENQLYLADSSWFEAAQKRVFLTMQPASNESLLDAIRAF
ncbi:MAG TPA: hypothetical protein PKA00_18210 [Saprospiraceae bacterium]|nr:hypothetical protein [Saprospiraceae bacterium]HMQ84853.1 hypothetical protein [Saprospiraceae bacterium]